MRRCLYHVNVLFNVSLNHFQEREEQGPTWFSFSFASVSSTNIIAAGGHFPHVRTVVTTSLSKIKSFTYNRDTTRHYCTPSDEWRQGALKPYESEIYLRIRPNAAAPTMSPVIYLIRNPALVSSAASFSVELDEASSAFLGALVSGREAVLQSAFVAPRGHSLFIGATQVYLGDSPDVAN